jgi:hypothetical protein
MKSLGSILESVLEVNGVVRIIIYVCLMMDGGIIANNQIERIWQEAAVA